MAAAQTRLLLDRGHEVRVYEKDNREIDGYGLIRKAGLFFKTADNPDSAAEVARIVQEFKPHVAHVHNTLPLLSPSIYAPLKKAGVKIVQYLHNYRLLCAAGTLYRDGNPCTLCVDGGLQHAVEHRCWTGSMLATLAFTRMLERHRRARTWQTQVDLFVALNNYQRELLIKKEIVSADKIVVQSNFLFTQAGTEITVGSGFVFAGRLVPEKGIVTLLKAVAQTNDILLTVVGDGPLRDQFRTQNNARVNFTGQRSHEEVLQAMGTSRALVFPSEWQEGCPSTVLEAFAMGKPVIAARVAGATELVQENITGLLFDPGDAKALAACMQRLNEDAELAARLGRAAREQYIAMYSPEPGYRRFLDNYKRVNV